MIVRKFATEGLSLSARRQVRAVITQQAPDRKNDIVVVAGVDMSNYKLNPIVLWGHDDRAPIANCIALETSSDKIVATIQFPAPGTSSRVDEIYDLIAAGVVRGVSIGLAVLDLEPISGGGYRLTATELLEISFVTIPANPNALVLEKGLKDVMTYPLSRGPEHDVSAVFGGLIRLAVTATAGEKSQRLDEAERIYGGGQHPAVRAFSKALSINVGTSGGFAIPNDLSEQMIPLLHPAVAVRRAGADVLPMPHGALSLSSVVHGANASWGDSGAPIPASQPAFGRLDATARKMTVLTPISNSLLRYSLPAFDKRLADHFAAAVGSAEDVAFLRSEGTEFAPRGLRGFAAADGTVLTSAPVFTTETIVDELCLMAKTVLEANVPMRRPSWVLNPATVLLLKTLKNMDGAYPFAHELASGRLFGWPVFETTSIPLDLTIGGNAGCTEVYLFDAGEALIFEGPVFELALARNGFWTDVEGNHSGVQEDASVLRCVAGRDFKLQHSGAACVLTGVLWHI